MIQPAMRFFTKLTGQAFVGVTLLSLSPLPVLSPSVDDLPPGVRAHKAGRYELSVKLDDAKHAKEGILGELIIPPGVTGPVPAIVFVHGNTRLKKYYKTAANFLVQPAALKKTIILSVQNWWPLSGDHLEGTEESRRGVNILVNRLANAGIIQKDKVFLSGFSAGGLVIVSAFLHGIDQLQFEPYKQKLATTMASAIDASKKTVEEYYYTVLNPGKEAGFFPYAGFISIKGNFYNKYFPADPLMAGEDRRKFTGPFTWDKKIVLTVGGDREAKDVKLEVPALREYLKREWGAKLDYHEYGDGVHDIEKTDQDLLWSMVLDPIPVPVPENKQSVAAH